MRTQLWLIRRQALHLGQVQAVKEVSQILHPLIRRLLYSWRHLILRCIKVLRCRLLLSISWHWWLILLLWRLELRCWSCLLKLLWLVTLWLKILQFLIHVIITSTRTSASWFVIELRIGLLSWRSLIQLSHNKLLTSCVVLKNNIISLQKPVQVFEDIFVQRKLKEKSVFDLVFNVLVALSFLIELRPHVKLD